MTFIQPPLTGDLPLFRTYARHLDITTNTEAMVSASQKSALLFSEQHHDQGEAVSSRVCVSLGR